MVDFDSLEQFLEFINQQEDKLLKAIEAYPVTQQSEEALINKKWVADALVYETKAAIRRKNGAKTKKAKLKQEALNAKIRQFKTTQNEGYGDQFNFLVCTKLDWLETNEAKFPVNQSKLGYAEDLVRKKVEATIDDQTLEEFLYEKTQTQKRKRLARFLRVGLERSGEPEKAIRFAAMMSEIQEKQTDDTWNSRKFQEIIASGLNGQPVNLISVLCCINQYDSTGKYGLASDIYAYLKDPKLYPAPLVIDELIATRQFFEFYGIPTTLNIYVADTEYTEVDKFGPVTPEVLKALQDYVINLQIYVASQDQNTMVAPISKVTSKNPLYETVKARILSQVTNWKDADFRRKWYRVFERYFEEMSERVKKRKIFPPNEVRQQSLNITRRRWAVNAAEGAVFATLDSNTVLVSTESRKRDQNYVIDDDVSQKFPPVLYILRAAKDWNQKIFGKSN